MRLWVTRTQPQADATAERLRKLGHEAVVQPVLETRPLAGARIDLTGAAAIAFTSRNAVAAFEVLSAARDLPVFTTGEATAQAARAIGFLRVEPADGGVEALAGLIAARRPAGIVVWPNAKEPAGDLAALLVPIGVTVRAQPVYETVATGPRVPAGIDGVLIHSPKAARIVAGVLEARTARELVLFAISAAAATPLAGLEFRRVVIATSPDEAAMMQAVTG